MKTSQLFLTFGFWHEYTARCCYKVTLTLFAICTPQGQVSVLISKTCSVGKFSIIFFFYLLNIRFKLLYLKSKFSTKLFALKFQKTLNYINTTKVLTLKFNLMMLWSLMKFCGWVFRVHTIACVYNFTPASLIWNNAVSLYEM